MKAVEKHVSEKWVQLFIRRWLQTPIQTKEGLVHKAGQGTPQGGVISPLLSNLFLHYVLDKWLLQNFPTVSFVRYADDVVVHYISEKQSHYVLEAIRRRLAECKLRLSEQKTKITYCKDYRRNEGKSYQKSFDFLGHTFKTMDKKEGTYTDNSNMEANGYSARDYLNATKPCRNAQCKITRNYKLLWQNE